MMNTKNGAPQHDPFDLIGLAVLNTAWWLLLGAAVAVRWALLFPMISIPVAMVITITITTGPITGIAVAALSVTAIMVWRNQFPATFDRCVTTRARTRFLTWWRYGRCWARLLTACHLTVIDDSGRQVIPRCLGVEIGNTVDRLQVRMLPGQCPADWENRTDHLVHAFRAQECRATIIGPATIELVFRRADSLAEPIELPAIGDGHDRRKGAA
ncbi:hypothetical protein [Nocardia sp. JCM 34519.1]|uniref:hypothetical protein n=2 Tax=unclassified Nocardia TaxID=2637762 RepID=UPI001CE3C714|nr:hypothetical protein [Nocardia sp. JCM 34519.1]